ncbi:uncharacterized protein K452DRAFT_359056 [Aplosporella prunicola CBS 121167]|uniref:Cytochrome P450 monooxygenase n=1 Tax=Aplosporella prunicola CBS 121167 TaxID=1176127 RepID=A0A6A6BAI5_9PEZI|nr:uncharacterized protein K452DRAFT_359056 [Aplosporella prunicola CBS 121167]KAF2141262.1 hypothetical protein K452DRAFT_359056 [Aplosporella prunicola CBS 121167]
MLLAELNAHDMGFALLILAICYPLCVSIYNVFFHPLRNYPGPKLNAVTRLPWIISLWKGESAHYYRRLHEQYGEVVRVNSNELSYTNAAAWKDIYGHRTAGRESFEKDKTFLGSDLVGKNGITRTPGDANHARVRRIFAHAFSDRALKEQQTLLLEHVNQLVTNIEKLIDADAKVGISDLYNFTTFDIIGDLTFGEHLGLLQNNNYTPWVSAIFDNARLMVFGQIIRMYPRLDKVLQYFIPQHLKEQRKKQVKYTVERVSKRLAKQTDRPDIWTYVLKHNSKDEEPLTLPEMHSTASTLMIAGSETTATLLSGLTYLLLKNPHTLERLCNEIRGAFKSTDEMDMNSLARLEYLNGCLEEALRIYPPVSVGMPRLVPPRGGIVNGKMLPGGATVSVNNLAAYHSPANFHRPDDFIPERWLPDASPRFAADEKAVLQPFSFGPRNCLGKNLAYHEMRLIMSNLLYRFDFEALSPESENWMDQRIYLFYEKSKLMVKMKRRV